MGIGGSDRFNKFNGIIDEVVIYNRILTPSGSTGIISRATTSTALLTGHCDLYLGQTSREIV